MSIKHLEIKKKSFYSIFILCYTTKKNGIEI